MTPPKKKFVHVIKDQAVKKAGNLAIGESAVVTLSIKVTRKTENCNLCCSYDDDGEEYCCYACASGEQSPGDFGDC